MSKYAKVTRFVGICDDCDHDFIPYHKASSAEKQADAHKRKASHKVYVRQIEMSIY